MAKKTGQKIPDEILFALGKIRIVEYSEQEPNENFEKNSKHNVEDKFEFELRANPEAGAVQVSIGVKTFLNVSGETQQLRSIKSTYDFLIKDYIKNYGNNDNVVELLPEPALINLFFIAISGVRGMLVANSKSSFLENHYLPLIDPASIVASMKQKKKKS